MSDPVTNVQIEDVLSSIRRLVSTDDRADEKEHTSQDSAEEQAEAEQDSPPEALVLTPSLRVSADPKPQEDSQQDDHADASGDGDDADQDWQDEAEQPDDHAEHAEASHDDDHDEVSADADDGSPVQDVWSEDHEQEHEDDHSDHSGHDDHHDHADDHHADDHHEDHHEETSEDADDAVEASDEGSWDAPSDTDELTARVAGFEEAVAARDDGWEPDGDSDDDNAAHPMEALPWQDSHDDADDVEIEDAEIVSPTEGLDPYVPEDDEDEADIDAPAFDAAAAAATAASAAAAANAFDQDEDPLGDEANILDEEALRDLVTDIVREELQGALGERITRNVRKLVRREIHRALTTKELE